MKKLFEILETATSQFHTVAAVEKELLEAGFASLKLKDNWDLERGGKYFLNQYGSSIFAFTIGEEFKAEDGYRLGASHGDFPAFRIKPNAGMENGGYLQLNTEPYGGLILSSWMDRPLSVAGRVVLKSDDVFHPDVRMIDMKRPVLIIPNLAIHFDREINSGKDFKKQVDMIPIYATSGEGITKDAFMQAVAKELGAELSDILDYELTIYPTDKPEFVGLNEEFVSSPRLDNITSTQALVEGITAANRKSGINMMCVFDHEEIGSRSKQGACSTMLPHVIEKIYLTLGYSLIDVKNAMDESMLMSVDVSHAYHPNYGGKYDVTNRHVMNKGFAIKEACSQSYATDCEAISIVQQICDKEGIAYQKFAKHSDSAGGGTLGCISSAVLPVRTVDIGVPLWGMHSSRETMGVKDYEALVAYLKAYYSL